MPGEGPGAPLRDGQWSGRRSQAASGQRTGRGPAAEHRLPAAKGMAAQQDSLRGRRGNCRGASGGLWHQRLAGRPCQPARLRLAESEANAALATQRLAESEGNATLATQRLADSEAISKFLTEVFRSPDPARDGRTITVAETLARGEEAGHRTDQPTRAPGQTPGHHRPTPTSRWVSTARPFRCKRRFGITTSAASGPEHPNTLSAMNNWPGRTTRSVASTRRSSCGRRCCRLSAR